MPLSASFIADFSSFDKAAEKSTANLHNLAAAGATVDTSLRQVEQSQDQLLDSIGVAGGHIQTLGSAAGETSGDVNTLSQSYRQFDGLLQAAGINIGPQVKGLEDIAAAAGKSASELGILGTAGLAAGAFMTGWKIGEWIDDMTGASTAVANLTGNLDRLKEQTEGAKMDTINRAIAEGAKETIKYTEAVKFLNDQVQVNADKSINWRDRLADAHREVRGLSAATKEEIAIAIEANATTEQLTNKYDISATALEILADRQKAAAAATAAHTREQAAQAAALDKAYAKLMSDVKNANQLAIMEADAARMSADAMDRKLAAGAGWMAQVNAHAKANSDAAAAATAYATEQDALTAANDALWQSVEQTGAAHLAAGDAAEHGAAQTVAGYNAVAQQVAITSDGVKGWLELMRATNAANALLNQNSLFTSASTLENQARLGTAFSPLPGFGGGSTTVQNTFNLTDSESNLAKRVSDLIMQQVRAGTQLNTA